MSPPVVGFLTCSGDMFARNPLEGGPRSAACLCPCICLSLFFFLRFSRNRMLEQITGANSESKRPILRMQTPKKLHYRKNRIYLRTGCDEINIASSVRSIFPSLRRRGDGETGRSLCLYRRQTLVSHFPRPFCIGGPYLAPWWFTSPWKS